MNGAWLPVQESEAKAFYIPAIRFHNRPGNLESFGFNSFGNLSSLFQIGSSSAIGLETYSGRGEIVASARLESDIDSSCLPRFADANSAIVACGGVEPRIVEIGNHGTPTWSTALPGTSNLWFSVAPSVKSRSVIIGFLGATVGGRARLRIYTLAANGLIVDQDMLNIDAGFGSANANFIVKAYGNGFAIVAVPIDANPEACMSVSEYTLQGRRLWIDALRSGCKFANGVAGILANSSGVITAVGNTGLGTMGVYSFTTSGRLNWSRNIAEQNSAGSIGQSFLAGTGPSHFWIIGQSNGALVGEGPKSGNSYLYTFVMKLNQRTGKTLMLLRLPSQLRVSHTSEEYFPYDYSSNNGRLFLTVAMQDRFNRAFPLAIDLAVS